MVIDKAKIEREAKEILDKFASSLSKIEKGHDVGSYVDREEFERVEMTASSLSFDNEKSRFAAEADNTRNDFKKRMLKNAPNHDDDFIIAEIGGWK